MPPPPTEPPATDQPVADPGASAPPPPEEHAPGLREQVARTFAAVKQLVGAHIELAKAELGDIMDEAKQVAALAGIAVAALLLVGLLLSVGLPLFLGETLFGSMGWGILHGTLLLAGVAVACTLVALHVEGVGQSLAVGALVGLALAVVLGIAFGGAIASLSNEPRPLIIGAGGLAIVFGLVGLLAGMAARGLVGALLGLIGGAVTGAVIGAIGTVALTSQVGAAIALLVGLLVWIALMGLAVTQRGIDTEALKARFWPKQAIETTKETIEWVREQTPLGRKS